MKKESININSWRFKLLNWVAKKLFKKLLLEMNPASYEVHPQQEIFYLFKEGFWCSKYFEIKEILYSDVTYKKLIETEEKLEALQNEFNVDINGLEVEKTAGGYTNKAVDLSSIAYRRGTKVKDKLSKQKK